MITMVLSNLVFIIGMFAALFCIYVSFRSYKDAKKLMAKAAQTDQEIKRLIEHALRDSQNAFFGLQSEVKNTGAFTESRVERIVTLLQDIQCQVKDLNLRVSIAEVRLEERKPQTFLPALPAPAKRGRKPKQLT